MDRFIKIHPNITLALDGNEISLLIAILNQDFVMKYRDIDRHGWSKTYFMKVTGMTRRIFDKSVKSLVSKGIMLDERGDNGGKNICRIDKHEYDKLNEILDLTNNTDELHNFFLDFWEDERFPSTIREEEMEELNRTKIYWKPLKDGSYLPQTKSF